MRLPSPIALILVTTQVHGDHFIGLPLLARKVRMTKRFVGNR